jgi:hypothetical protein
MKCPTFCKYFANFVTNTRNFIIIPRYQIYESNVAEPQYFYAVPVPVTNSSMLWLRGAHIILYSLAIFFFKLNAENRVIILLISIEFTDFPLYWYACE